MKQKSIIILIVAIISAIVFGIYLQGEREEIYRKDIESIVMVTSVGGLGDEGFNDAGWRGVQMARMKWGLDVDVIETKTAEEFSDNISKAAEKADIVVALGFMIREALMESAPLFPETYFIYIDEDVGDLPNVASYQFYAAESGYLAGIIAASISQNGKVGIVQGMDIPPVLHYSLGFNAGVKTWNEAENVNVEVLTRTIGSFVDPQGGRAVTEDLLAEGADVFFNLTGGSGEGVYGALIEANHKESITMDDMREGERARYFAIGEDVPQDDIYPGLILLSALKKIPETIFMATEDILEDNFKGGLHLVGFREGSTGISEMPYTKQYVSPAAITLVEEAKLLMAMGDERLQFPLYAQNIEEKIEKFEVPSELLETE